MLANIVSYFHAYKFTHFAPSTIEKTKNPAQLGFFAKLSALVFGINNPRPTNTKYPRQPFKTLYLSLTQGHRTGTIECWFIPAPQSKGVVAIFHGFSGCKSMMLDHAEALSQLGYSTLLVDFIGSGGSSGHQTSLGFHEAEEVKVCFRYLQKQGENNIILCGASMGAVAVLKALSEDSTLTPKAAILECPFGSLRKTTLARFQQMQIPSFPMADLLLFWGGVQSGFWAFGHVPEEYAKHVAVPVLMLHGGQDKEVSMSEISAIFSNLRGQKEMHIYPDAKHESYLKNYQSDWQYYVEDFMAGLGK